MDIRHVKKFLAEVREKRELYCKCFLTAPSILYLGEQEIELMTRIAEKHSGHIKDALNNINVINVKQPTYLEFGNRIEIPIKNKS